MNINDLPKATSWGSYRVYIPLKDIRENINRYLENGLQLYPDFQRGHVWTREQQIKYIEYKFRNRDNGTMNDLILFNHPGWMKDWRGEFVLVDGLQRLTAMVLFMENKISTLGYYSDEFDKLPFTSLGVEFCVNNLKTRKEVLQWYLELNSNGTPHSQKELDRVFKLYQAEVK